MSRRNAPSFWSYKETCHPKSFATFEERAPGTNSIKFLATNCIANDFPTDYVPHHVADWTFLTWFTCEENKAKASRQKLKKRNRQYSFNGSQSIAYIGNKSTWKTTSISFQKDTSALTEGKWLEREGISLINWEEKQGRLGLRRYLFGTKLQYSCDGLNHLLLYGVTCAHHEAKNNVL